MSTNADRSVTQKTLAPGMVFCRACGKDCHPACVLPTPLARKAYCLRCWERVKARAEAKERGL